MLEMAKSRLYRPSQKTGILLYSQTADHFIEEENASWPIGQVAQPIPAKQLQLPPCPNILPMVITAPAALNNVPGARLIILPPQACKSIFRGPPGKPPGCAAVNVKHQEKLVPPAMEVPLDEPSGNVEDHPSHE